MGQLQKYKDDFTLLLEGGFIAASHADEDSALKLFKASQLLKPENTLPKIGFGYIHLLKLELKQACHTFEDILKKDPSNEMCRAMLGLSQALTIKEVDKGEKLLLEALKNSDDKSVKSMASTAIEFIEKFVKKSPSPALGAPAVDNKKKKKGKS
ncbi:MAG: hypothetical protein LVR00_09705 [Rhabdochlamydiaceae bacterium]|jgi:tetratricopeptide (TPR) repeat protein